MFKIQFLLFLFVLMHACCSRWTGSRCNHAFFIYGTHKCESPYGPQLYFTISEQRWESDLTVVSFVPMKKRELKRKADTNADLSSAVITSLTDLSENKRRRENADQPTSPSKGQCGEKESRQRETEQTGPSPQLKYCEDILKEMLCKKHSAYAWPFYLPVNAVALQLHDYHDIIKYPMDLSTVKVCLVRVHYLVLMFWCLSVCFSSPEQAGCRRVPERSKFRCRCSPDFFQLLQIQSYT